MRGSSVVIATTTAMGNLLLGFCFHYSLAQGQVREAALVAVLVLVGRMLTRISKDLSLIGAMSSRLTPLCR